MLDLASALYHEAHTALGEEADHVEIVRWLEERAAGTGHPVVIEG
jgi:hypothetical protein